jgi:uncharacterized protein involved in exopolysaccharide biosynthesis
MEPLNSNISENIEDKSLSSWAKFIIRFLCFHHVVLFTTVGSVILFFSIGIFSLNKIYQSKFELIVKSSNFGFVDELPGSIPQRAFSTQAVPTLNEEKLLKSEKLYRDLSRVIQRHERWKKEIFTSKMSIPLISKLLEGEFVEIKDHAKYVPTLYNIVQVIPDTETDIVTVSFKHQSKEFLSYFSELFLHKYLEARKEVMVNVKSTDFYKSKSTYYWLEWQRLLDEISKARDTMTEESIGEIKNILEDISYAQSRLNELKRNADLIGNDIFLLEESGPEKVLSIPVRTVINNKSIQQYSQNLLNLITKKDELSSKYHPEHPDIIDLNNDITNAQDFYYLKLNESLTLASKSLRNEMEILRNELQESRLTYKKLEQFETSLKVLEQKAAIAQEQVQAYEYKYQQTLIKNDFKESVLPDIAIMTPPYVGDKSVFPNRKLLFIIAVLFGLILGFSISFLMEIYNDKIRDLDDLKSYTHASILTHYPLEEISKKQGTIKKSLFYLYKNLLRPKLKKRKRKRNINKLKKLKF